jgi:subtilase family serine protease
MGYRSRSAVTLAMVAVACSPIILPRLEAQEATPAVRIIESIDEGRLVSLKGNTHPLARPNFDRGRVSADLPMGDLFLVLRRSPEQQAAFDAFVASQYEPKSANYHQWLTPAQVGERFGPAPSDIALISSWLRNHGFTIDEISKDRLSIRFSGAASQVESAFHTEIHHFEVPDLKTASATPHAHIANLSDPQIPAALATVVVGVKALHNFFPRPLHHLGSQVSLNQAAGARQRVGPRPTVASKVPGVPVASGVRPQLGTVDGYGDTIEDVTPYDFATIYNVLPLWKAASPIDGTGQTIAIAGTSNINLADVAAFRAAFGLPAKVPTVLITNGDPGRCPSFNSSCAGDLIENTLDVEWSGAVAKGANITLVTSSAPTPTTDALYLSESYIVQHKTAAIMNVSYGECEVALGTAGNTQYNNLWQTAATEGIAVFVASGDSGSPACDQGFDATNGVPYGAQFGLAVSGLASTAYDTAVGGTDFNWGTSPAPYWSTVNTTGASALGYIPEVPWNSTCANPLILPSLESDAAYIGVAGVKDAESACNFVIESGPYIATNYGVNLAGLVDTIGGGGGASNCTVSNGGSPLSCSGGYPKPSFQAGVPGIPADAHRDIPDVSFFASNGFLGSSYLICVTGSGPCTYSATTEPVAQEVGGTSVASPAMAGVMALINQKSAAAQGNPNKLLYTLAAQQTYANCSAQTVKTTSTCVFNDINTGTNTMPCISGSPFCSTIYSGDPAGILTGYSATVGYDAATGLGSLNVANVVNLWPTSTTSPVVSLSVTSLTFASTTVGVAAANQAVTLKNTGKSALALNGTGQGITITGTNATSFTQTNTCGTSVAAGASCVITVTFKPVAAGALSASLHITDNAFGSPQAVALAGTGAAAAPTVTLSASALTFGSTTVGSSNTAPAITLTNSGTGALTITSIAITGTNATSFSATNTCGTSVAKGASCSITITFKPTAAGTLTASLGVTDNATGSPQKVTLSGTGQ